MCKKYLLLFLSFAAMSMGCWAEGRKWSLKECLDYAAQNNITIQKNNAQIEEAKINVTQQENSLLPTVSASMSQSADYRPFQESASSSVIGSTVTSSSSKVSQNGSYGVNASWTVFNGWQTHNNIELAKLNVTKSQLQKEINQNSIKEQIIQLYIQILYTKEAKKVNEQLLDEDEILYERGKNLLAQGQIARYELLELKTQVANGRYDIVNTQTQIDQYLLKLMQLMELSPSEDFDIEPLNLTDAEALELIPTTSDVYGMAVGMRPEVKSNELAEEQADINLRIAKAGYLPTVSLSAGAGNSHSTGAHKDWFEQMKRNFNMSVGFTVSVPIFDAYKTKTSIQKAEVEKTIARLDGKDTEKTLYNTIATYRLTAYNNQQKYISGKERLQYNEENYAAVYEKNKIGTMSIAEVLNARASLLNARQEVLQSKYLTIYNKEMLNYYANNDVNF